MSTMHTGPIQTPPSRNTMGIVGFVISLIGILCTCGVLSPLGLLICLFAVFRAPRGFATAGIILGVLGTILAASVAWLAWQGISYSLEAGVSVKNAIMTVAGAGQAAQEILAVTPGSLPPDDQAAAIAKKHTDGWDRPFTWLAEGDERLLVSAGPDGAYGTEDDWKVPIKADGGK
ncbi:MAG: hypothetical protein HMLKMBBP_02265 [Planctomycetes bacterium]|nr:hypothetical protein [Planctomycetota bacterium]